MYTLFLTSDGLVNELQESFLELLGQPASETTAAFIPTAADPQENNAYVARIRKQLDSLGMKIVTIDLKEETRETLVQKLEPCKVIFVNGGNSYYLLDWVRKSGFAEIINDELERGKIYVGVSAGSYITCPNIEMAGWKHSGRNTVNLEDLTGLNLVPFLISAHYKPELFEIISKASHTTPLPIVCLTDTQAVMVQDGRFMIVGSGDRVTFNNFIETKS